MHNTLENLTSQGKWRERTVLGFPIRIGIVGGRISNTSQSNIRIVRIIRIVQIHVKIRAIFTHFSDFQCS